MKNPGLIAGFLPLVVYGILTGPGVTSVMIALSAAFIATIFTGWRDLRKGMILSWANLALFGFLLVIIGVLGAHWVVPFMSILVYAALAAVTFGSMAAHSPFTLQYARGMVDPSLWDKPAFIRVNYLMTGVWGGVFSLNALLSAIALTLPSASGILIPALTYGVLAAGILFTIWYPGYLKRKGIAGSGSF